MPRHGAESRGPCSDIARQMLTNVTPPHVSAFIKRVF
jgi:hypothetical protein